MSESFTTIGEPAAPSRRWKAGKIPVVGLIGGVGGGKSTVAALLAGRGAAVIDADAVGHAVLKRPEIASRVVDRFGPEVLGADGAVDRRSLGRLVFADPAARVDLEALVHPPMFQEFARAIAEAERGCEARFVVLDAAILLESGWDGACDLVAFVDSPRATRLERVRASRGWTEEELAAREAAQWPIDRKKARADYVLKNEGDAEGLEADVDRFVDWLESEPGRPGCEIPPEESGSDASGDPPSPPRRRSRLPK
ncbi:dephospho-CoA kinase [Paludisphaera soli]|uniref:dephospho-CoA kinase n=1 Tax=Paludisphaera soli TaxID=2712865 RepID=UPI0013EAE787|nr:dephospho-CoA kinase [Paludisphaera soli]